ncbi:MFS transporter [Salimicrobium halophilum]|uniref:Predicted arabinose efflux permease, MFS family n=1 Tax=Salimicrobium halophilum TaxID=86666 RepID=A0A1G8S7B4_9BACI|nr:MFS transporter [Salimicrobium halophilum]SDJ25087.1 Predicted arabinose efflux permease, MFS family [Salimicrobium halophilum]
MVKEKDYTLLAVLSIFFMTAGMGTRPLVSILGNELGASSLEIGIIIALFPLLPLFLSVYIGRFINVQGSKGPLLISATSAMMALSLPFFWTTLPGLIVSQIIAGGFHTAFIIAAQSYVGQSRDGAKRDHHVMKFSIGAATGTFLGPAIGGSVADAISTPAAFLVLSMIGLIAVVMTFWLTKEPDNNPEEQEGKRKAPIGELVGIVNFRRAIYISTMVLTGKDAFTSFFPLLGVELGLTGTQIGLIVSANALAGLLVRWGMTFFLARFSRSTVVLTSVLSSGLMFLVLPFFDYVYAIGVVAFILGLGVGLGQPLSISTALYALPKNVISQGLGVRITANRFVQVTSPLLFGAVAQVVSVSSVFWLTGAIYLFGSVKTRIREEE